MKKNEIIKFIVLDLQYYKRTFLKSNLHENVNKMIHIVSIIDVLKKLASVQREATFPFTLTLSQLN